MRSSLRLPILVTLCTLALAAARPTSAQTLDLPYEFDFVVTELGSSLEIPALHAPPFDLAIGNPVGISVRVDIDRICGESMYTNNTGVMQHPDVIRNLQIAVANLATDTPLSSRQPLTTGSILMDLPAGQTMKYNECGGPSSLFYANLPLAGIQQAAFSGGLGLDVEITPAPPPAGVTLNRFATYIEGRITLVWHFEAGLGNGAASWSGSSPWSNLNQGLPGAGGRIPSFMGTGLLAANEYVGLVLFDVAPGTPVYLVAGGHAENLPFKGGIMVPFPNVRLPLVADIKGSAILTKQLSSHVAGGGDLYLQFWVEDAGAVQGFSASNAILASP